VAGPALRVAASGPWGCRAARRLPQAIETAVGGCGNGWPPMPVGVRRHEGRRGSSRHVRGGWPRHHGSSPAQPGNARTGPARRDTSGSFGAHCSPLASCERSWLSLTAARGQPPERQVRWCSFVRLLPPGQRLLDRPRNLPNHALNVGVVKSLSWRLRSQMLNLSTNQRDTTVALAQLAEHRIVAPKVTGSSPVGHPTLHPERNLSGAPCAPRVPAVEVAQRSCCDAPTAPTPI
jgi:hypothetical protein